MSKAVFGLLCLVLVATYVLADGGSSSESSSSVYSSSGSSGSHDGGDDGKLEDQERDIDVKVDNSNGIELASSTKGTTSGTRQKSSIRYQLDGNRLSIELRSSSKDMTKTDFKFKLKLGGIVEYVESGAHAGFQRGEDTVGTMWQFNKDKFSFKSLADTTVAGVVVKNFQGQSDDGVFTIVGHMAAATYAAGSQTITPGKQKFDIIIDTTTFSFNKTGSRLALIGAMQSSSSTRTSVKDDKGSEVTSASHRSRVIQFGADASPTAFFDWATNVTVMPGNVGAAVITSSLVVDNNDKEGEDEGENNKAVAFAFDAVHPAKITWDPSVGVGAGAFSGAATAAPIVSLLAALAVAVAFFSRQ